MFKQTGKYLRKCREAAGISQTELQKSLGYKGQNSMVCKVEAGRGLYSRPAFFKLRKLVKIEDGELIRAMCQDYSEQAFTKLTPILKKKALRKGQAHPET